MPKLNRHSARLLEPAGVVVASPRRRPWFAGRTVALSPKGPMRTCPPGAVTAGGSAPGQYASGVVSSVLVSCLCASGSLASALSKTAQVKVKLCSTLAAAAGGAACPLSLASWTGHGSQAGKARQAGHGLATASLGASEGLKRTQRWGDLTGPGVWVCLLAPGLEPEAGTTDAGPLCWGWDGMTGGLDWTASACQKACHSAGTRKRSARMPSDASLHLVDPRACLCPSLGRCLTASCSSAPLSFLSPLCRAIPSPPEEAHKHERSHAPQRRHPPQVVDLSSLDGGPRGVWAHWAPWEKGGASTKRRGWMGGWMSFLARGVWSCVRAFPLLGPFWVVVGISDGRGHSLTGAWAESGACFALPGPRLQDPAGPAAEISRCADGGEECVAARANVFPLLCSDDATISHPPPPPYFAHTLALPCRASTMLLLALLSSDSSST
ncbi:hypothetical protein Purlil1_8741 [Purpureocillium lilacinum]|uniref:Uncharacterized protein n=1 Tax=Purpureocillium lilacinum TaxID=33203 RepID=A0ABR0BSN9_PURLI|nr:hypothetical protein Purlil1_8741 [Purpureocillium lilacinum]